MKKKIKISILLFFIVSSIYSQDSTKSRLDLIQGIWENTKNNKAEGSYTIITGMNSLSFSCSNLKEDLSFPLNESIKGFQNLKYENFDSININSLKNNGKYYTSIIDKELINKNGWVNKAYVVVPKEFECDGMTMSIYGGQLVEFNKIDTLPIIALKMLYIRGKIDKRNYIKEYLKIDAIEITTKCFIYKEPEIITPMYLIKGDLIIVLEEKGEWIKVKYQGNKTIYGWLKRQNIK